MGRVLLFASVFSAIFAVAPSARCEDEPPPRWMARLQIGVRSVSPSAQEDLLAADGYSSVVRFVATADYARRLTNLVALGGWADFSHRGADAKYGGPTFQEYVGAAGVSVPLLPLGWDIATLVIVPRLGYGLSWMSIGRHPRPVGGIAYGVDVAVLFPRLHISLEVGFLSGPTGPPGGAGRNSNFGGVTALAGAVIDG
jgi:hypothetical protein